jgi:hypothetical protein
LTVVPSSDANTVLEPARSSTAYGNKRLINHALQQGADMPEFFAPLIKTGVAAHSGYCRIDDIDGWCEFVAGGLALQRVSVKFVDHL